MKYKDIDSPLEFKDISTEMYRTYHYLTGDTFTVQSPIGLNVSKSGGHKIICADSTSYYIRIGWIAISWCKREGEQEWLF